MASKFLIALSALAATASASTVPRLSTRDTTQTFRLSATTPAGDLSPSVQGLEVSYTPADGCLSDLLLVSAGTGAVFSTDGSKIGVPHYATQDDVFADILITPGGSSTVASALPAQLQCQNGTAGIATTAFTTGVWQACPAIEGIYLSSKQEGQRTLEGCADVTLVAKCDASQDTIDGAIDIDCVA